MRPPTWAVVAAAVVLLAAGVGLLLLALPEGETTPSPTLSAGPTPPAGPSTLAPSPSPPIPLPTPGPYLHTVQEGETLSSIAAAHGVSVEELISANGLDDPNLIQAGQELVIPGADLPTPAVPPPPLPSRAAPTPPPLPTPAPSEPLLVEIGSVLGAGDVETEMVQIRNRGGAASLEDWTLSDAGGDLFTFPRIVLFSGAELTLHSGAGESTPAHLYWGRTEPAWEAGQLIILRDREETVVDTYLVP